MNNESTKLEAFISSYQEIKRNASLAAGRIAVNYFKEHFRLQGFRDNNRLKPWKRRVFNDGASRSILVNTGRLRRDIRIGSRTTTRVVITAGKTLPGNYAVIHNEGGEIQITERMRRFFWAKFFESGDERWKALALKKGSIKIPKRQFIGNSSGLATRLDRHFERAIKRALDQSMKL